MVGQDESDDLLDGTDSEDEFNVNCHDPLFVFTLAQVATAALKMVLGLTCGDDWPLAAKRFCDRHFQQVRANRDQEVADYRRYIAQHPFDLLSDADASSPAKLSAEMDASTDSVERAFREMLLPGEIDDDDDDDDDGGSRVASLD
jgi:hypothetical protein